MEENNKPQLKEKNKVAGTIFVGCLFLGMGIGFLTGHLVPGLFIGMGVGFIAGAVYRDGKK